MDRRLGRKKERIRFAIERAGISLFDDSARSVCAPARLRIGMLYCWTRKVRARIFAALGFPDKVDPFAY